MEFLTILLSSLLALVSPVGLVVDKVIANNLRSRLSKAEQLEVRVDNAPSYQLAQGKVERVRVAGRGLWVTPDMRIGALEVETDPINVNLQRLTGKGQKSPKDSLEQPAQAGVRLILTEDDINKALRSPTLTEQWRRLGIILSGGASQPYQLIDPRVDFLDNNRLRFQVELQREGVKKIAFLVESGLGFSAGHTIQLIEPIIAIDGRSLSPRVVSGFAEGISRRFNLRSLEQGGITARVLQLKIDNRELELAAFVRVDSSH